MRWLADECISARLVKLMRDDGQDVSYGGETAAGASDTALIGLAFRENRLLLTDDKDFGELVVRRRWVVPGLVLMRLASEESHIRWLRLKTAIKRFDDGLFGQYVVIEEARFRIRPMHNASDKI